MLLATEIQDGALFPINAKPDKYQWLYLQKVWVGKLTISIEDFNATDIGAIGIEADFQSASSLIVKRRSRGDMTECQDDIDNESYERHSNGVKML
jgi:hypothetical protein